MNTRLKDSLTAITGVRVAKETQTPGFQLSTPWGVSLNVNGMAMLALVIVFLLAGIGAWTYVSKISIEHGGTYVRIKGVTASRDRHTGHTSYVARVEGVRVTVDADGVTNYMARVEDL